MRILTLDDMAERQRAMVRWFVGHEHVHAWTAAGAIRELEGPVWDLVMLDHDLAEEHYLALSERPLCHCVSQDSVALLPDPMCSDCGGTGQGEPTYAPGTGMDVADYIAKMPKERWPKTVIVHSWNPVRSWEMSRRLNQAGVNVWKVPFNPQVCPVRLG